MDSSRRRLVSDQLAGDDSDLEDGEYVLVDRESSDSDDGTDDDRFDHQSSRRREDGEHGGRTRRLEDIIAAGGVGAGAPLPASPTLSSESEGTISDDRRSASSGGFGGGGGGARPARKLSCHVCGKEFSSQKAVDGHMRVHGSGSHVVAQAEAVLSAGWATTGRRGSVGGKAGKPSAAAPSLNSESTGHSTAIVPVQAVQPLEPVPLAFAKINLSPSPMPSSTRTNLSGEDDEGSSASASATATAIATAQPMQAAVVTGANPSSTRAGPVVDPKLAAADQAPAPQVHRQAVSVPVPVPVPPPAAQQAQFTQQPLMPPPAAALQLQQGGQLAVPPPAEPPREYSCRVCGKTYPTHQGLGGHAAGHRNRQREQEALAAAVGMMMPHGRGGEFLAALRRGRRAEEPHACSKCHKVFATGVALGGHMRMHYNGPPIVHKNKKKSVALVAAAPPPPPTVTEADLRRALSNARAELPSSSSAPPAVAATGRLRLFGFDIGPLVEQAPPEQEQQEGSGTEEGGSSSAGDDGEQQHK